jgi:hypothetical protein
LRGHFTKERLGTYPLFLWGNWQVYGAIGSPDRTRVFGYRHSDLFPLPLNGAVLRYHTALQRQRLVNRALTTVGVLI